MLDTVGARVLAVRAGDEQTSAAGLAATRGLTVAVVIARPRPTSRHSR